MLTDVGGSLASPVLSTPSMIRMMEWAAGRGARCTARATLREVVDGRKLFFDVDVVEGDRVIDVGTHQRRVVDIRGS